MTKKINAILIHENDNVITGKETLSVGSVASYQKNGQVLDITVTEEIPQYHKIALADVQISEPVYKYGQLIGEAIKTIKKGSHVHDHNIMSPIRKPKIEG